MRVKEVRRGGRRFFTQAVCALSLLGAAAALAAWTGAQLRVGAAAPPRSRSGKSRRGAAALDAERGAPEGDDIVPVGFRGSPLRDELLRARISIRSPRESPPVARAGGNRP
jgi:hypothetical protein